MGISKASLLTVAVAGILMAGCQSSRFDNQGSNYPAAPLRPAPSGTVQKQPLTPANPNQFPTAPTTGTAGDLNTGLPEAGQQVASLPPETAPTLTVGSVAGVWNANLGGQSCKIATPQTKFGQGYRAGPLRCPGELASLASWAVNGKQLTLYNANGDTVASLYSSGASRFDGQTSSGQAVSLSR
ncbi:protease inhibitor Inh/omp19 family protein [Brucellaceae bacterium C25G]